MLVLGRGESLVPRHMFFKEGRGVGVRLLEMWWKFCQLAAIKPFLRCDR